MTEPLVHPPVRPDLSGGETYSLQSTTGKDPAGGTEAALWALWLWLGG